MIIVVVENISEVNNGIISLLLIDIFSTAAIELDGIFSRSPSRHEVALHRIETMVHINTILFFIANSPLLMPM